jgi:hypothetical protein
MGFFDRYKQRFPQENDKKAVNIEWVLKTFDWSATELANDINDTIGATLDSKADKADTYTKSEVIDIIYPVGCYYTQFADTTGTFLDSESPSTLFGGTWSLQFNTDGVFFKTEGYDGTITRSNGIQTDAIRNITGTIAALRLGYGADGYVESTGAFYGSNSGKTRPEYDENRYDALKIHFDASRIVPIDTYNHPRNRLIRVWKRTG